MPIFDYYAQHPEQWKIFAAAMTGSAGPEVAAVMADYDFSGIGMLGPVRSNAIPVGLVGTTAPVRRRPLAGTR
jgi:hypothetical protein